LFFWAFYFMAIVYTHKRNDTGEIFYVGVGKKESRSRSHRGRSDHWKNIVNKVGYSIEIIAENISYDYALNLERHLIKTIGRQDLGTGPLVNKTDGGEGILGIKTPECVCPHCNKKGHLRNMKRWHFDNCSEYTKIKHPKFVRKPQKKLKCPHCDKTGESGVMYRWHFDNCLEYTKKPRIKKIGKSRLKLKCPHCGKIGGEGSMNRWHFDNCSKIYKREPEKKISCPHCLKEGSISNMKRWHFDNCKTLRK